MKRWARCAWLARTLLTAVTAPPASLRILHRTISSRVEALNGRTREDGMQDASRQTTMAVTTSTRAATRLGEGRPPVGRPDRVQRQAIGTGAKPPPGRGDSMKARMRPISFASDAMRRAVRGDGLLRDRGSDGIALEQVTTPPAPRFDNMMVPGTGATCPAMRQRATPRLKARRGARQ